MGSKGNRDSRTDFEKELNILGENLKNGRVILSVHLSHMGNELTKARYSPNKRVNLITINEMIRTLAMRASFQDLDVSETEKKYENEK